MTESNAIGVVLLGLGGSLLGLAGVVYNTKMCGWKWRLVPLVMASVAAILALTGGYPLSAMAPLGVAAVWLAVLVALRLLVTSGDRFASLRRPGLAWGALLVVCPVLALVWTELAAPEAVWWEPEPYLIVNYNEVHPGLIRTDNNRVIHVLAPARPATPAELDSVKHQTKLPNLICTDAPGVDYNCHGWVFTGGQFWLSGVEVAQILRDNDYQAVSVPRPGDIIVYRRGPEIVHTGLVRAVDDLGVIIESKWGTRGRYIHVPENQDYADDFTYYRSGRQGHLLQGLASLPGPNTNVSAPAAGAD